MLDRYAYGEVRRISPEAPVPVTRVKRLTSVLGGAGNVAANLAGLGVQVYVAGMTGEDDHRRVLEKKLRELGVDYSGLIASPKRSTITKMRIIGARQQMLRLDFEEPGDLLPDEEQALLQWLRKHLDEGLDGIVLSDYAKGTCSDRFCQMVITQARAANVPVLVDPKGSDWAKYRGCDLITPNVKEMCEAAGKVVPNVTPALVELAQQARETFDIRYVVVTRSEKGVTLVGKMTSLQKLPRHRKSLMFLVQGIRLPPCCLRPFQESFPLLMPWSYPIRRRGLLFPRWGPILSIKKNCSVKSLLIRSRKALTIAP